MSSTDRRFGKRYRNVQSVFSINNDDESQTSSEVEDDLHNNLLEKELKGTKESEKVLSWSEVVRKTEIGEHFEGEEAMDSSGGGRIACYIGLSRTHMHIFHKMEGEVGKGSEGKWLKMKKFISPNLHRAYAKNFGRQRCLKKYNRMLFLIFITVEKE